jgi:crotonobetainyl-CoA:carnitine CoA-transferase CaiB-like acyl-CoA transferase
MDCDVSLYDTAITMLTYLATWHLSAGHQPVRTRRSAHPSLVPFQAFPARDGWLILGCAKEKFWTRLVDVLDEPALHDVRFATFADRAAHRDTLEPLIDAVLATRDVTDWLAVLQKAGVPCAPINTVEQALAEPHTLARDLLVSTTHPRYGTVTGVGSPVRVGENPETHRRAPQLGEHTGEVLRELLGYDYNDLIRLSEDGAFRPSPQQPKDQI